MPATVQSPHLKSLSHSGHHLICQEGKRGSWLHRLIQRSRLLPSAAHPFQGFGVLVTTLNQACQSLKQQVLQKSRFIRKAAKQGGGRPESVG